MGIKMSGFDLGTFVSRVDVFVDEDLVPSLIDAVNESSAEGAKFQQQALEQATTSYGERRFAAGRGRGPGRDDTGNMIDSIEPIPAELDGYTIRGGWGWEEPEDYFLAQEYGVGNPPPALSLRTSQAQEEPRFFRRVDDVAGSM